MWNAFTRLGLFAVVFALITFLASIIEPFGLDEVIERQSRDVLYRTFAAAYDGYSTDASQFSAPEEELFARKQRPDGAAPPPARERIVTVFVNETVIFDIRRINEQDGWSEWRPNYYAHADILNSVARVHEGFAGGDASAPALRPPPAVFIDFLFVERGTGETAEAFDFFIQMVADITRAADWPKTGCATNFEKLLCIKEAGGVPLVFARPVDVLGATAPAELEKVAILAPVLYEGFGDAYPTFYPNTAKGEATPAMLLYLASCMDRPEWCPAIAPKGLEGAALRQAIVAAARKNFSGPVSVVWGSGVPDDLVRNAIQFTGRRPDAVRTGLVGDGSVRAPGEAAEDALRTTCRLDGGGGSVPSIFLRQVFGGVGLGRVLQACPHHLEVPFSAFAAGHIDDAVAARNFDGRAIVIGAQFRNAQDWTMSAVHGQIAGMHRHAMALDNLMAFNTGYIEAPMPFQSGWIDLSFAQIDAKDILDTLILALIVLVGGLGQWWVNRRLIHQGRLSARDRRPSHLIVYVTMFAAAFLLTFGSTAFAVLVLRMEPPNWIGHLALAVAIYIYLLRDEFFDDLGRVIRHTGGMGGSFLGGINWWMRYFDLETLGFEKSAAPRELKDVKTRLVRLLYPPRQAPIHPTSQPQDRQDAS